MTKKLTKEDRELIDTKLNSYSFPSYTDVKKRYKEILLNTYPLDDMYSVEMATEIIEKWKPGSPKYDPALFDDIDSLGKASVELAALNSDIALKKAYLEALEEETKTKLEIVKASLTRTVREMRSNGEIKGSFTEKEVSDLVKSSEKFLESFSEYCAVSELCASMKAIYFSVHRLEEMLNNRVRTLASEWGRVTRRERSL